MNILSKTRSLGVQKY